MKIDFVNLPESMHKIGILFFDGIRPSAIYSVSSGEQLTDFRLDYLFSLEYQEHDLSFVCPTDYFEWREEDLPVKLEREEKQKFWQEKEDEIRMWLLELPKDYEKFY